MTTLLEEAMKDTSREGRLICADLLDEEGRELDALLFRIMGLEGSGFATWQIETKKWIIQYDSFNNLLITLRLDRKRGRHRGYSFYKQGCWTKSTYFPPKIGEWCEKDPPKGALKVIMDHLQQRVLQLQRSKT